MISGVVIGSYPNAGSLSTTPRAAASGSSREIIEGYAMLVHTIMPASRANGPGLRCVVFVQGCNLGCPELTLLTGPNLRLRRSSQKWSLVTVSTHLTASRFRVVSL